MLGWFVVNIWDVYLLLCNVVGDVGVFCDDCEEEYEEEIGSEWCWGEDGCGCSGLFFIDDVGYCIVSFVE